MVPYLERTLDLSREYSSYFAPYKHIADPHIDDADEGMTAAATHKLLCELKRQLVPMVRVICEQPAADDSSLRQTFAKAAQFDFALDVAESLGYDLKRGRLDLTRHPFSARFSAGDVGITTRVSDNDFGDALFSTLHEAGHAMYEQGISAALDGTPLGHGVSAGVHESQSRLWENVVASAIDASGSVRGGTPVDRARLQSARSRRARSGLRTAAAPGELLGIQAVRGLRGRGRRRGFHEPRSQRRRRRLSFAVVFLALVRQWRLDPFNPHAVAAFRPQAYQIAAILLAAENLIAWDEFLMAVPSAELVEEAARRFEEAERIVGRPPVSTSAIRFDAPALSVAALESGAGPADPALASVALENALSLGDGPSPQVEDMFLPDLAIGYFCLPPNPKIKALRNRIQDRLFKVHHCLDLFGNPRTLPLYDLPISPDLLADAAMAELNVSQAVMDAYRPRLHYRFLTLLTLAKTLIQQVSSLGAGLLANMEKRDAESLSVLRATHEAKTLERASDVRKLQVEDTDAAIKVLDATLATIITRVARI